jgi:hypothetical protein
MEINVAKARKKRRNQRNKEYSDRSSDMRRY